MTKPNPSSSIALLCCLALVVLAAPPAAEAGAYIFAGASNGVSVVAHPITYFGTGGVIRVGVCIDPASPIAADAEISVRNIITTFNAFQPQNGNVLLGASNDIPAGQVDFESTALHELGHCIGLAHPNTASESGLGGANTNYTRTTRGADNTYDLDAGADGVRGSSDDLRGDDLNLHWFEIGVNNPFTQPATVEGSTYSRDLVNLPAGHTFAANADRALSTLMGLPLTEAVMQQGAFTDEDQRALAFDDVTTLRFGMSGIDEIAGNADDYTIELFYAGMTTACDVLIRTTQTAFASCSTGATTLVGDHIRITSATITLGGTNVNWYFNDMLATVDAIFADGFEAGDFASWTSANP